MSTLSAPLAQVGSHDDAGAMLSRTAPPQTLEALALASATSASSLLASSRLRHALDGIANLEADWDGYGSPKPSLFTILEARQVLTALTAMLLVPEERISLGPAAEGGVAVAIAGNDVYVEIELANDGTGSVIVSNDDGEIRFHEFKEFATFVTAELSKLASLVWPNV